MLEIGRCVRLELGGLFVHLLFVLFYTCQAAAFILSVIHTMVTASSSREKSLSTSDMLLVIHSGRRKPLSSSSGRNSFWIRMFAV